MSFATTVPHQGVIQNVDAIGGSEDDDARRGVESVHLNKQLIERIFRLGVGEGAAATFPSHGVDLVDE